jgi:hypothetical protein
LIALTKWSAPAIAITLRKAIKLKSAKQPNGTAKGSNKSRFIDGPLAYRAPYRILLQSEVAGAFAVVSHCDERSGYQATLEYGIGPISEHPAQYGNCRVVQCVRGAMTR